ncbi:MAG: mechanosensitive ion channel domain-containing protein [archaeon]
MVIEDPVVSISNSFVNNGFLMDIVTAVIILLFGFIIGRIIGQIIFKLLKEFELDKNLGKVLGYKAAYSKTVSKIVSYFIYLIAIVMALESIGLAPLILNMMLIVIIIIIGISVLIGAKDFLPNLTAGFSIKGKKFLIPGARITVGEISGKIIKINLLDTHIETTKKDLIVVPNSYFVKNVVLKKKTTKKSH